ncbi:hypothetical protein IWX46DRAFT_653979 [Phyllosticta citricarpa]|uniref:Uncharacterized protein n=2 Tax=Phyllosticta TaxID=121621 RepID=A0ABR1MQK3_9PEZI
MNDGRKLLEIHESGGGQLGDGRTLYRALARQLIGNPNEFTYILGEVLHHYLRIWLNAQHPLHRRYHSFDHGEFYKYLSEPDRSNSSTTLNNVLEVVSNALRTHIRLKNGRRLSVIGPDFSDHVRCQILLRHFPKRFGFSSQVPENSGETLIDRLIKEKKGAQSLGLTIKEIRWWWDPNEFRKPDCANEFALPNALDSAPTVGKSLQKNGKTYYPAIFSIFVVSVKEANQIRQAVDLLERLLPLGPGQQIPVNVDMASTNANKAILRPYVGIDAEFKLVSRERNEEELQSMNEDTDDTENLCTVLSIAIDRHVTFCFHILHMLENRDSETVGQLTYLWERIIFNNDILKIWFNFQSDINVLDATIANSYQGTGRRPYLTQPFRATPQRITPQPKLAHTHLSGVRPDSLKFPSQDEAEQCAFHKHLRPGESYPRDIACPCRTGNLDIETVIALVCRQLGLRQDDEHSFRKRRWTKNRPGYGYSELLDHFLKHDWVYPLLTYFKDIPRGFHELDTIEVGRQRSNDSSFYRSFGPSMETDSDKMGYNIGDVVGIALVFRILTTTDDQRFLLSCLRNVSSNYCRFDEPRSIAQTLFNNRTRHAQDRGIPLIDENPRSWSTNLDRMWTESQLSKDLVSIMEASGMIELDSSYITREKITDLLTTRGGSTRAMRETHVKTTLYDPLRFELPKTMTKYHAFDMKYNRPVVFTMDYYVDDLLSRINDAKPRNKLAPSGLLNLPSEEACRILSHDVKRAFESHRHRPVTHKIMASIARKTQEPMLFADYVDKHIQYLEEEPPRKLEIISGDVDSTTTLDYDGLEQELRRFRNELEDIEDAYLVKPDDPFEELGQDHVNLLADDQNRYERTAAFNNRTPVAQLKQAFLDRIEARRKKNNEVQEWESSPPSPGEESPDDIHRSDGKAGMSRASNSIGHPNVVTRSMARLARKRPASTEKPKIAKKRRNE